MVSASLHSSCPGPPGRLVGQEDVATSTASMPARPCPPLPVTQNTRSLSGSNSSSVHELISEHCLQVQLRLAKGRK